LNNSNSLCANDCGLLEEFGPFSLNSLLISLIFDPREVDVHTQNSYDNNNNLITAEDFNSNTSSSSYDAKNNKTESTDPNLQTSASVNDARNNVSTYGYNEFNQFPVIPIH